jgi:hypothetical protein
MRISRLLSQRLLWALVVSLLVHFLLVSEADFSLPDWTKSEDLIEVSLAPPPPAPPAKPAPRRPSQPEKPATKPIAPRHEEPPVAPSPEAPVATTPESAKQEPAAPPQPVVAEPPPPLSPVQEEPVAVPPAPKRVEIDYKLFRGKSDISVGKVKQTFHLEDENRYTLHSVAEATGLISLFYSGKYEELSEGLVTARGLQPHNYRLKRGSGKSQAASFNWGAHTVSLEAGTRRTVVEVSDGTQDMLSFMYQFMFVPPLNEMLISMANGKKLKVYAYAFEGEDQVETQLGKLRAWHIAKSSADNDDKLEFWLAPDYRYLPVKIRQTERDGTVTELLATRLLME